MSTPVLSRHRFTVADFHRLGETGVLTPDCRVELIEGELFDMAPIGSLHGGTVLYLTNLLASAVSGRACVGMQNPLLLDDRTEVYPDVFILKPRADWYRKSNPRPDDVLLLMDALTQGPVILVGSSMGGWIALLVALARPERVVGIVGVAAAPDFTQWGFTDADKALLRTEGRIEEPTPYGDQPYVTTLAFWESGQALRVLEEEIALDCPVRLLQGQADPDVPWDIALRLAGRLRSSDVQTLLIKDGDHRLSRDTDIALLIRTVAKLSDIA